jgi:hypothetical protein
MIEFDPENSSSRPIAAAPREPIGSAAVGESNKMESDHGRQQRHCITAKNWSAPAAGR